MVYRIVKYGDPVLETKSAPVTEFGTDELRQFVDDMFETMYAAKGLGLAAPQVGLGHRVAVVDCSQAQEGSDKVAIINPEIVLSEGKQLGEEGCLSIPGFREDVHRAQRVRVRAYTVEGEPFEIEATDLFARALQHEIDHLDGVLFIHRISPLKRDLIRRRIRKLEREGEWE